MTEHLEITPLGDCGLLLRVGALRLAIDPPRPVDAPTVLTWSEAERIAGARAAQPPLLAADSILLAWIGRHGMALPDGAEILMDEVRVRPRGYRPIPYATPTELCRKIWSAVQDPARARARLAVARKRPDDAPYALRITMGDWVVAYLHQALHRFQDEGALKQLLHLADDADVVIAGTDYDDEAATGAGLGRVDAPHLILGDFVGPVRKRLGLPVRDLSVCLASCPPRTVLLDGPMRLTSRVAG